jgi:hypothetical protein
MHVRWALKKSAQSYAALKDSTHRALNTLGRIPTYIAGRHAGLLPAGVI